MSKIYSHSRLSTFEQCPLRFKFRYIDKIESKEKSIEAHLGKSVHSALEWLYTNVKKKQTPTIDQVIIRYSEAWEKNYDAQVKIVKNEFSVKDYFNKGVAFVLNYYMQHQPFDDGTIECEKQIKIDLDPEANYKIQGFIDRLVYNLETGEYEVHDYKTANSLPSQDRVENDRQLALYAIAIKELFGDDKEVCLVWHYLAHNKKICSRRTNKQLHQLKKETIELIKKIEAETKFLSSKSALCNWCEYKIFCHEFGNTPPKKEKQEELDIW